MHYLVELYSPKPAWLALPQSARADFFAAIGQAMAPLAEQGVEALTLAETERTIAHASPHQFLAIWRFPTPASGQMLLAGIAASGWYDYFDTVNASCASTDFASHLAALTAL